MNFLYNFGVCKLQVLVDMSQTDLDQFTKTALVFFVRIYPYFDSLR